MNALQPLTDYNITGPLNKLLKPVQGLDMAIENLLVDDPIRKKFLSLQTIPLYS
jgi:hypothetical protein